MESKQMWMTIALSSVAAFVIAYLVASSVISGAMNSPGINSQGSSLTSVSGQRSPDLTVTAFNINNVDCFGGVCDVSTHVEVENIGDVTATPHLICSIVRGGGFVGSINCQKINGLAPGQKANAGFGHGNIPQVDDVFVYGMADLGNNVPEINEGNNVVDYPLSYP